MIDFDGFIAIPGKKREEGRGRVITFTKGETRIEWDEMAEYRVKEEQSRADEEMRWEVWEREGVDNVV